MKKYYISVFTLICLLVSSCNFLDVVPDEIPKDEDAFKSPRAAEKFLYSCYAYLPNVRRGGAVLDLFTGDEVVSAFEHENFAKFPQGNFTANAPGISYWNDLFAGIRQCYILKKNIDKVPDLDPQLKTDYLAQADFLLAYYHYSLLRCYGPIILVKEQPSVNTPPEDYLPRSSYDECVEWIADKFAEAQKNLPEKRTDEQRLGLATKTAAKAIVSRMYLYAASPLFNGNTAFYSNFKLMPQAYDANKWKVAKSKAKEAIDAAEAAGYRLYEASDATNTQEMPEPTDSNQRAARFTFVDKMSKEVIWASTLPEEGYSIQNKSRPYWEGKTWNGICPTVAMLDRFYTKRGLPIDEDPEFDYSNRFDIGNFQDADKLIYGEGETTKMNIGREPRYYAWVSFHNGYYECMGEDSNKRQGHWAYWPEYKRGASRKKILTQFFKNSNCGYRGRTNNYSPGGFLNKKGVPPNADIVNGESKVKEYPWPIVRLAELYLNYAEACVETGDLQEAKTYIDKVRKRVGLPTIDESWGVISVTVDQAKLRKIVRQERMIELYLEGHNFWDMRRWLLAEQYFGATPVGLNKEGDNINTFSKKTELTNIKRKFISPTHYLLPIPYGEIQRNSNLVQNPGY